MKDLPPDVPFKEIWLNGLEQLKLSGLEPLGVKEGMALIDLLKHPAA